MPSLGSLSENVVANLVVNLITKATFWLILILVLWIVIGLYRRHTSRSLREDVTRLLGAANDAIDRLLNAAARGPDDQIRRDFEIWHASALRTVSELRRRGVCSEWQLDHFEVLGTVPGVGAANRDSNMSGQIAEKAQRLKNIARDLDRRAERLWPFGL